jgi:hypothetical protein
VSILAAVIRDPGIVRPWTNAQWNQFLQACRLNALSARLGWVLEDHGLEAACPSSVWTELKAQRCIAEYKQSQVRLELRKLHKALAPQAISILLLKGAAYAQAELRLARGRDFADLDIMVQRAQLEPTETALELGDWLSETRDRYDQRYYRRWMHELPPMHHRTRSFEVDIHHALLPLTGRLRPDPTLLWAASRPLPNGRYRVLCNEDMLLHSAAQLFQDGEIAGQFGSLLDLHQLMQEFGADTGFWDRLIPRAEALQLGRPLYYALRFCSHILGTAVPSAVMRAAQAGAPGALATRTMDMLVPRVLEPRYPTRATAQLSAGLLYMRSHWLRMPPGMLALHLTRKALRPGGKTSQR